MTMNISRRLERTVAGSRNALEVHQNVFCAVLFSAGSRSTEYKELLLQEVSELLERRLARAGNWKLRTRLASNLATLIRCRRAQ